MKKKLLLAGSAVAALFVIVVVAIPFILDANQFRSTLEGDLSNALGRKVTIGHLKVAILSGGISVDDISIADDPAFSPTSFLTAKAVNIGVELMPLIFSKQLHVQSFRLEEPQLTLRRSASGQWNFSSLGTSSPSHAGGSSSGGDVSIQKLTMTGGRVVVVGSPESGGKSRLYEDVSLEATSLSYASQFPFHLSAKTPGSGTVSLAGHRWAAQLERCGGYAVSRHAGHYAPGPGVDRADRSCVRRLGPDRRDRRSRVRWPQHDFQREADGDKVPTRAGGLAGSRAPSRSITSPTTT